MMLSNTSLVHTLSRLAFITLFLMLANKVNSQDSTSFTFNNFKKGDPKLIFQGTASVPSSPGNLRLTDAAKDRIGRVVYSDRVRFWDDSSSRVANFEATITFVITHVNNNPADGIAFFIAPTGTQIPNGADGAHLGIFNPRTQPEPPQIIAVEFDTFVNYEWDPSYRHVGIDINSILSSSYTRWESVSNQVVTARIKYDAKTEILSAEATGATATVTYKINLRNILPEYVQVGIAGATGDQVAVHEIRSWSFTSNLVRKANKEEEDMHLAQYV